MCAPYPAADRITLKGTKFQIRQLPKLRFRCTLGLDRLSKAASKHYDKFERKSEDFPRIATKL